MNQVMVNYIGFREKNQLYDLFIRFQGSAQYLLVKYDGNQISYPTIEMMKRLTLLKINN